MIIEIQLLLPQASNVSDHVWKTMNGIQKNEIEKRRESRCVLPVTIIGGAKVLHSVKHISWALLATL